MKYQVSLKEAKEKLAEGNSPFTTVIKNGTMSVEYYAPEKVDLQQPHMQDELYFITSGTGIFNLNGNKTPFQQGDVIFVPAGIEHRFESFSDDFTTYAVFWGPGGGETPKDK